MDTQEFIDDLKRIKYVKKLITRFIITTELKDRLILNHLIILNNVFGAEALAKIAFLKMAKQMRYLKPFLLMINVLPKVVYNVGGTDYDTDSISMDERVVDALRKL